MNKVQNLLLRWQEHLDVQVVSEVFIRVSYLALIWSTIKLLFIGDVVWGSDYLHLLHNAYSGIDYFAMLLNEEAVRAHYMWIAIPFLALLALGVLGRHNFVTRILVCYLFVLLHYGNVEISTGGHHLYQQLLFFHIVLFRVDEEEVGLLASSKRLLHHLGFYAIWLQIALLYFISGYWKLKGNMWLDGEAMLMTLSFKEFSYPWISENLTENRWYLILGNYISLAYQLLFAFLIWIKPIRKQLLFVGLLFHLSITIIVGIADFGIFMIASYAIFLPAETAVRILKRVEIKPKR